MKLVSFRAADGAGYGRVEDDEVIRLDGPGQPATLAHWLGDPDAGHAEVPNPHRVPLSSLHLLPPIPNPDKIFCVATNFHEPERPGFKVPDYPLLFTRIAAGQVGHLQPIIKPFNSDRFDFEGELAVVIGKAGRRIDRTRAMTHVAGYALFMDGSVRDWQKHSTQFTPGKNFAGSGAFGPWLVTADEIANPYALRLETRVNGVTKQAIGLDRMIFDIAWLIEYCSTFAPLVPGDVIVTGTPSGFGSSRTPPEFLAPGDTVEVEIEGIGVLRNTVEDEKD